MRSQLSALTSVVARAAAWAFSPTKLNRARALDVLERVSAITHATSSAEQLANHHERMPGGVNDWRVARGTMAYRSRFMRNMTDLAARPGVTNLLHAGRLGAALLLVSPFGSNQARAAASSIATGAHLALAPRHYYGADGSDHVALLSQALSLAARVSKRDPKVSDAVLWLASVQGVMSYAVSGWVKLAGDRWRNDEAVIGIMRTKVYGNAPLWRLLRRYPVLNKVVGRATLALECGYPVFYLARGRLTKPLLAASGMMHLSIAASMGLGRFVTSFLSFYGAMAYTTQPRDAARRDREDPRDDRMAAVLAGSTAVALAALFAWARARRTQVLTPAADERPLVTRSGARIYYRSRTADDGTAFAPVFVLENGLMAPSGFWGWLSDELHPMGDVITYHRAGYGASLAGPGDRDIDTLVSDLESLIIAIGTGRRVVLVGHSLGGHLVHKLAQRRPDLVDAVVLVDSSHPHELERSAQQRLGSETLVPSLRLSYFSLQLGLGPLLETPTWAHQIPADVRDETMRIFHDARLWQTALSEWQAAVADFEKTTTVIAPDVPVLALSARASISSDNDMLDMHRELADGDERGRHVVIDDANHESILTSQPLARRTALEIGQFLESLDVASDRSAS